MIWQYVLYLLRWLAELVQHLHAYIVFVRELSAVQERQVGERGEDGYSKSHRRDYLLLG